MGEKKEKAEKIRERVTYSTTGNFISIFSLVGDYGKL